MKKQSISKENAKRDHLDYLHTQTSSTDCTGVVFTGGLNDAELSNLNEVYPFLPESSTAKKEDSNP